MLALISLDLLKILYVKMLNIFDELLLGTFFKKALLSVINHIYNISQIKYDWLNDVCFCCQGSIFKKPLLSLTIKVITN